MVQFSQINVIKNYTNLIFIFHDHTFWESFILLWVFLWVFESQVSLFIFLKGYTFLVCSLYKVFDQYLDIPFFHYLLFHTDHLHPPTTKQSQMTNRHIFSNACMMSSRWSKNMLHAIQNKAHVYYCQCPLKMSCK